MATFRVSVRHWSLMTATPTETLSVIQAVEAPTDDELNQLDAYWRTANYLAVGMIYLQDNPLLREPLRPEHIKNRLLGTGDPALDRHSSGPMPTG